MVAAMRAPLAPEAVAWTACFALLFVLLWTGTKVLARGSRKAFQRMLDGVLKRSFGKSPFEPDAVGNKAKIRIGMIGIEILDLVMPFGFLDKHLTYFEGTSLEVRRIGIFLRWRGNGWPRTPYLHVYVLGCHATIAERTVPLDIEAEKFDASRKKKEQRLRRILLEYWDRTLWGDGKGKTKGKPLGPLVVWFMQRALDIAYKMISVHLQDISVSYTRPLNLRNGKGRTFQANIERIMCGPSSVENKESKQMKDSSCNFASQVSFSVVIDGLNLISLDSQTELQSRIIRQWWLRACVVMPPGNRTNDRAQSPLISVDASLKSLLIEMDAEHVADLADLIAFILRIKQSTPYLRYRPRVPVKRNPRQWWSYSIRMVCAEMEKHRRGQVGMGELACRRRKRIRYVKLYLQARQSGFLARILWNSKLALAKFEEGLLLEEIAHFRSFAYIQTVSPPYTMRFQRFFRSRTLPLEKIALIEDSLVRKNIVKAKRALPLELLDLHVDCPKIGVSLSENDVGIPAAEVALQSIGYHFTVGPTLRMGGSIRSLNIGCKDLTQIVSGRTGADFLKLDWTIFPCNTLDVAISTLRLDVLPGPLWPTIHAVKELVTRKEDGIGLHIGLEKEILRSMVHNQFCQITKPPGTIPQIQASLGGLEVNVAIACSEENARTQGILHLACPALQYSLFSKKYFNCSAGIFQTSLAMMATTDLSIDTMAKVSAQKQDRLLTISKAHYQHIMVSDPRPRSPGSHAGRMFISTDKIRVQVSEQSLGWVLTLVAQLIPPKSSTRSELQKSLISSIDLQGKVSGCPVGLATENLPLTAPSTHEARSSHLEMLISVPALDVQLAENVGGGEDTAGQFVLVLGTAYLSLSLDSNGMQMDCQLGHLSFSSASGCSQMNCTHILSSGLSHDHGTSKFLRLAKHLLWQKEVNLLKFSPRPSIRLKMSVSGTCTDLNFVVSSLYLIAWPEIGGSIASTVLCYVKNASSAWRNGRQSPLHGSDAQRICIYNEEQTREMFAKEIDSTARTRINLSLLRLQLEVQSSKGCSVASIVLGESNLVVALCARSSTVGVKVGKLFLKEKGALSQKRCIFHLSNNAQPLSLDLQLQQNLPLVMKIQLDCPEINLAISFLKDAILIGNMLGHTIASALKSDSTPTSDSKSREHDSLQPSIDIQVSNAIFSMGSPDQDSHQVILTIPWATLSLPHSWNENQTCKVFGGESTLGLLSFELDGIGLDVHTKGLCHGVIKSSKVGAVLQQSTASNEPATKLLVEWDVLDISLNEILVGSLLSVLQESLSEETSVQKGIGHGEVLQNTQDTIFEEQTSFGLPPWEELTFELKLFLPVLKVRLGSYQKGLDILRLMSSKVAFGLCTSRSNNTFITCSMAGMTIDDCSTPLHSEHVTLVRYPQIPSIEGQSSMSLSCVILHNRTVAIEITLRSGLFLWPYSSNLSLVENLLDIFRTAMASQVKAEGEVHHVSTQHPNLYINAIVLDHKFLIPLAPFQSFSWEDSGIGINIEKSRIATFVRHGETIVRVDSAGLGVGLQLSGIWDHIIKPTVFSFELMQAVRTLQGDPNSILKTDMHLMGFSDEAEVIDKEYLQSLISMAIHCKCIVVCARFSHIPYLHCIIDQFRNFLPEAAERFGAKKDGEPGPSGPVAAVYANRRLHIHAMLHKLEVGLVEDKQEQSNSQVFQMLVSEVTASYMSVLDVEEVVDHAVSIAAVVSIERNDPFQGELYPFVEPWPVEFHLEQSRDTYKHLILKAWLHSDEKVSIILSKSLLLCIGDAIAYGNEMLNLSSGSEAMKEVGSKGSLILDRNKASFVAEDRFVIQNLSGMRLWYRAGENVELFCLMPGKPEKLKVLPCKLNVSIRNPLANQFSEQVEARGISLRFEGNWLPVKNVVVSHVSRQLLFLEAPGKNMSLPFILEVAVVGRTKVISIHSALWIQNRTDRTLFFECLSMYSKNLVEYGLLSSVETPNKFQIGPLQPKEGIYLPLFASVGGELLVRAEGYKFCARDSIMLGDPYHMEGQEGLLACISSCYGAEAAELHIAMQVNHRNQLEPNQPSLIYSGPSSLTVSDVPIETELSFLPPLIAANGLPYPISLTFVTKGGKVRKAAPSNIPCDQESFLQAEIHRPDGDGLPVMDPDQSQAQDSSEASASTRKPVVHESRVRHYLAPGCTLPLYADLDEDLYIIVTLGGLQSQECMINLGRYMPKARLLPKKLHLVRPSRKAGDNHDASESFCSVRSSRDSPRGTFYHATELSSIPAFRSTKSLRLELQNRLTGLRSSARQVCIYASTLIDNRSGIDLLFKRKGQMQAAFLVPSIQLDDEMNPVLECGPFVYSSNEDLKFQIPDGGRRGWSPVLNVHKVGARDPVKVRGPPLIQSRRHSNEGPSRIVAVSLVFDPEAERVQTTVKPLSITGTSMSKEKIGLYEFTVQVRLLPSSHPQMFGPTRILTIKSRYAIDNRSGTDMEVIQRGVEETYALRVGNGQSTSFHWTDHTAQLQLLCRPCSSDCYWSGGLSIDVDECFYGMSVARKGQTDSLIIPVNITSTQHETRVIFLPIHSTPPPYLVENLCENVTICLSQVDQTKQGNLLGEEQAPSQVAAFMKYMQASELEQQQETEALYLCMLVAPKTKKAFAMHEPLKPHVVEVIGTRLRASSSSSTPPYITCPIRKYDLTMVAEHKPLIFPVETEDSEEGRSISRKTRSMRLMLSSELGKHVYVTVNTVGNTRVLQFSDKKNRMAREEEKSLHALSSRLRRVRYDLQELNKFLSHFYNDVPPGMRLTFSGRLDARLPGLSARESFPDSDSDHMSVAEGPESFTASGTEDKDNNLFGGNLRVTVVSAKNLPIKQRSFLSNAFVFAEAAGQTQRSGVSVGTDSPIWNDVLLFQSLCSTDILHLEVLSKSRDEHKFLGQTSIPLSDTLNWHPSEDQNFVLSRRDAEEEVSGTLKLRFQWEVTSQSLLLAQLRIMEKTLSERLEILSLLRPIPSSECQKMQESNQTNEERIMPYELGGITIKLLEVNVGDDSTGIAHYSEFATLAHIECNNEDIWTEISTDKGIRATNKTFRLENVPPSSEVRISLYSEGLLGKKKVGYAEIQCTLVQGSCPFYVWLPCKSPEHTIIEDVKVLVGVNWTPYEYSGDQQQFKISLAGFAATVLTPGVGELVNANMRDIDVIVQIRRHEVMFKGTVKSLQVDNQLIGAEESILVKGSSLSTQLQGSLDRQSEDGVTLAEEESLVSFEYTRVIFDNSKELTSGDLVPCFKRLYIKLQELDVAADQQFLEVTIAAFSCLPLDDLYQSVEWQERHDRMITTLTTPYDIANVLGLDWETPADAVLSIPQNPYHFLCTMDGSELRAMQRRSWTSSWMFLQSAILCDIRVNVTLALSSSFLHMQKDKSRIQNVTFGRLAEKSGFQLVNLNNAHIYLKGIEFKNQLLGRQQLREKLIRHYLFQGLTQIHKVLSGAGPSILQAPLSAVYCVSSISSLLTETSKGRKKKSHAVPYLFFIGGTSVSQFCGAFSRTTVAFMKFASFVHDGTLSDDETIQRYSRRTIYGRQALYRGAREFVYGIARGGFGLVMDPIIGVLRFGPVGFFAGAATGIVGAALRPLGGCLECAGKTSQAAAYMALGKTGYFGNDSKRVRPPGQFSVTESVPDASQLSEWKGRLQRFVSRAEDDHMKDVIYVQPNAVILITDRRIVFMKKFLKGGVVRQWKLCWHLPTRYITGIKGNGSKLRVEITRRSHSIILCGMSYLHTYQIECATTSKFRSLVVRLNAQAFSQDSKLGGPEGLPWLQALDHNCDDISLMHAPILAPAALPSPVESEVNTVVETHSTTSETDDTRLSNIEARSGQPEAANV